eukprot:scaffold15940_cov137-Amphora_coffeaeformis.AAC.1
MRLDSYRTSSEVVGGECGKIIVRVDLLRLEAICFRCKSRKIGTEKTEKTPRTVMLAADKKK